MPFYLKTVDVVPEVLKFKSILIVVCRFCPAVSMAVQNQQPYIKFFRSGINTKSYEQYINDMKSYFKKEGIKTKIFKGKIFPMPLNFIICLWNKQQRQKLLKMASKYEAVIVLSCEPIYNTINELLESSNCQVYNGMKSEGILDAISKLSLPLNISLKLNNVTPVYYSGKSIVKEG